MQREYRCTPEVDKAIDRPNQNRSERVAPIGTPGLSVDHVRTDGTHHAPTTASSEIASRTRDEQTFQGERQLRRSLIRSFFRLNREAKGYVCRPVENFQDVIAKSTTELARSPLLRKQLNAAIASVTFGTSGVGFLHFSLSFRRSFPARTPKLRRACATNFGRFHLVVPLKSSLRSSSNRRIKTTSTASLRKAHSCCNAAALNQILVAKLDARSDFSPDSN